MTTYISMMKRTFFLVGVCSFLLMIKSCLFDNNTLVPISQEFTRIYPESEERNIRVFNMYEHPEGEGYYIFGLVDTVSQSQSAIDVLTRPYIKQIDNKGIVLWDTVLSEYNYPSNIATMQSDWIEIGGKLYTLVSTYTYNARYELELLSFDPRKRQVEYFDLYEEAEYEYPELSGDIRDYDKPEISFGKGPNESLLIGRLSCKDQSNGPGYYLYNIGLDLSLIWESYIPSRDISSLPAHLSLNACEGSFSIQHPQIGFYEAEGGFVYANMLIYNIATDLRGDLFLAYSLYQLNPNDGTKQREAVYMASTSALFPEMDIVRKMPFVITETAQDSMLIGSMNISNENVGELYPAIAVSRQDTVLETRGTNLTDAPVFTSREYDFNDRMIIKTLERGGQRFLLYIGNTYGGEILITVFNIDDKKPKLVGKERFAVAAQPYEFTGFIETLDGGFALCGKTTFAGRSGNLFCLKYSKATLNRVLY